jgi:uncharacterized membrane protein YadS
VKLVRVLMLGPVVLFFALRQRRVSRLAHAGPSVSGERNDGARATFRLTQFVPWFIIGFLLLATLRAVDAVPQRLIAPSRSVSSWLTVLAMSALGLGCDLRVIAQTGRRVLLAATGSLLLLIVLSVALIHALGIH